MNRVTCNLALYVGLDLLFVLVSGGCSLRQMWTASLVVLIANIAGLYEGMGVLRSKQSEPKSCGCQHCN